MSIIPFIDALTPIVNKALAFIPDPEQRIKAEKELIDSLQAWDSQQVAINVEEAKNGNIFVAGWRPFIGWTCGAAFAWQFVLQPFLVFFLVATGVEFNVELLPVLDTGSMMPVLFGMLGIGGMRSFEKIKGVTK